MKTPLRLPARYLPLLCAFAVTAASFGVAAAQTAPAASAPAMGSGRAAIVGGGRGALGGRGGLGGGATPPGPAAPVPPEVAIARPSAAEIAQVNDAVKKFIATDASVKPLLDKYPGLIVVQPPRANTAIAPSLNNGYMAKHNANVELAKQGNIDLLFMGDSITDFWRNAGNGGDNPPMAGKEVFDQYFGSYKTANFGIAGDTTQGVLYRLQNGEGQGFQPKAIMLMIGTNNAGPNTSAEIAEGVGAVVLEMRKDFPNAKILLLGIFPRGNPGDAVRTTALAVNPIIAKLDDGKNVFYLDIGAKFLDADGVLAPDIMADKLHPTKKGYGIWAEAVKDPIANLMK